MNVTFYLFNVYMYMYVLFLFINVYVLYLYTCMYMWCSHILLLLSSLPSLSPADVSIWSHILCLSRCYSLDWNWSRSKTGFTKSTYTYINIITHVTYSSRIHCKTTNVHVHECVFFLHVNVHVIYCIARNFRGIKLLQKSVFQIFVNLNFCK